MTITIAAQGLTTDQLAAQLQIKPQTLRAALCRDGAYFGVRPHKMPNRRLLWPVDAAARLMGKGDAQ
ncbi:hypothetical protein [Castellaniella sp.]|uniref:hypothetical protein n=1 Tax=Castellaniella sp. TaxID=1955812 RepID=UPI002AFECCBB|nr:hypothetical protein [Castellaniella sp.]